MCGRLLAEGIARRHGREERGLTVNVQRYSLVIGAKESDLSAQEYQIMQYLMRNKNTALSRRQLAENALGMVYDPTSRTVDMLVFALRKKVGKAAIQDRPGFGYMMASQEAVA